MIETLWTNLTEGQGALVNGFLTVIAAGGGVLLGAWLFGGRVATLQSAIDASKLAVDEHVANMDTALKSMRESTSVLEEVLAGMASQVSRIESNQVEGESHEESSGELETRLIDEAEPSREKISELWNGARDHLEDIASSSDIDGRTRAKYMRIDRRSYEKLIDALLHDEYLSARAADAARSAFTISKRFRRRAAPPTRAEVAEMQEFVDRIAAAPIPSLTPPPT